MNILFIGDIFGKPGRKAVRTLLHDIQSEYQVDYVIANGENMSHGKGFTKKHMDEMLKAGVNFFTSGNHSFGKEDFLAEWNHRDTPVVRPANYLVGTPGKDHAVIETPQGKILLINILGKVYMGGNLNDPFDTVDRILNTYNSIQFEAIIVDFHAEATAEKYTMRYHLDGRITALFGTHTHVPTADAHITAQGMAYITDIGMTGAVDSSIGLQAQDIYDRMHSSLPVKAHLETQFPYYLRAVYIGCEKGKAMQIELIQRKLDLD